MWMNSLRFNVRSTSSSATYSRIRGNKSFRLDEKQTNKQKTKQKRKVSNEIYLTTFALHFLKL